MTPLNTSVLLIYTGGTIGMIENTATGALEAFNFEQLQRHVPELQKFNFPIDTYQFDPPMDSSDMEPDMWRKLVRIIHENYDRYHGFVILHGTDTMAYTASALSLLCWKDWINRSSSQDLADRGTPHGWKGKSDDKYRNCRCTR